MQIPALIKVAANIIRSKDGVKALQKELNPVEEVAQPLLSVARLLSQKGTVIGDGKLKINLALRYVFFMDQVATAWTPDSKADRIIDIQILLPKMISVR